MIDLERRIAELEKELDVCENEMRYLEDVYYDVQSELDNCTDDDEAEEIEDELQIIEDDIANCSDRIDDLNYDLDLLVAEREEIEKEG